MSTRIVVLRRGHPIFEYSMQAEAEDDSLLGEAKLALAVFRRLNPTVSLFDPKISIRFEKPM